MRNILIVEDTDYCSDALEVALADVAGIRIHSVATAEAALLWLHQNEVCAIVTDLHLAASASSMDGFDFIAAVSSEPSRAALPILVISGDPDPNTPARLVDLGVNAFFAKPYSPAAVRHKLEQLIDAIENNAVENPTFENNAVENA